MPRIVSLVPSSTETLVALGADVVACTRFCEQPEIPAVGGTKNPDIDAIAALAPDVVVLDEEENRREDADALAARGIELLVTDVRSVADALDAVARLAARTSTSFEPAVLPDPVVAVARRRALVPIWRRPWMALGPGTYGADVLGRLGLDVVPMPGAEHPDVAPVSTAADRYPVFALDDQTLAPDVVVVPSEPYSFSDAHLDELRTAFAGATVRRVDGQDLLWWGVRTPAAIERLATALGRAP
jgi:ABC-type hemin transport system substrate-binding protein